MSNISPRGGSSLSIDLTEFRRGWRILILALIGIGTSVSVAPLYSFGTLIVPLQQAFGWTREQIQPGIAFLFGFSVISVQLGGWLIRRHGVRPVALISLVTLAAGYLLMTLNKGSIIQFYAGYSLLAFAGLGTTMVTWTQLVNLWFDRNRGLALAIILCGTGLCALVMPNVISWAIAQWDWRAGYWILAAIPLVVTLPLTRLWLTQEVPVANTVPQPQQEKALLLGMPLRLVVRSKRFWLCNVALTLATVSMIGMVTNTVPMLRDRGMSAADAATAFSVYGISLILGRVLVGYLVDRLWAPGVALVVMLMPAMGCFLFYSGDNHMGMLMLASLLVGFGAGAELDIAAFLMARYFGMRDYSRVFAMHMGVIGLISTLAPFFFGYLYARSGAYTSLMVFCMISFVSAAVLLPLLGRYPTFADPTVESRAGAVPVEPVANAPLRAGS